MNKIFKAPGTFPFLCAVFLNAFVDLGHKIVIQNTIFKMYDGSQQVILTAIVNGLILLPFILLFSPAGFMSDRFSKHRVMRVTAWTAVFLTLGITACYALGWFWAAFAMTFLLAAQSAFYSPAKLGYIRGFFGKEHLAEANGVVSAVTIIAILAGTLVFSILFESFFPANPESKSDILVTLIPVGLILVINSIIQLMMTYRLRQKDEPDQNARFDVKRYVSGSLVKENLQPVLGREVIRLSIIGLAMFWSVGQVMLAAFPAFAKAQTGEENTIVIQAILAASGLGIALGSFIASRISRNYIETGLIPIGAAGIATGLWLLPGLQSQWLMGLDFLFIGTMGGLFIVPLNAMIQFYAREHELGKVLAGNNLIQNLAMMSFLIITVLFALAGISSQQLLMLTAVVAVVGGCYTIYKLPQSLIRYLLARVMSQRYRLGVHGMRNIPSDGGVLLLGNHISWIDWAIVQLACPRPVQFVMIRHIYERWYLNWFFRLFGTIPIESGPSSAESLERVSRLLNEGKVVCLFPEGIISRTGHLAEFRHGYERATEAANAEVVIVPFYLRGLWGSQFSHSSERHKRYSNIGWKRDIIVAFGVPVDKDTKADILKRRVFDLSVSSWRAHAESLPTLADAWIDTAKRVGKDLAIADDTSGRLSGIQMLSAGICFARRVARHGQGQNIGALLPTSVAGALVNMAVLMRGNTIVNLNYTAGSQNLKNAMDAAQISTVFTSRQFLKKLAARGLDIDETLKNCRCVYVEDLRAGISKAEALSTFTAVKILPAFVLKALFCRQQSTDSIAAILFSSGSEGKPKGVLLSHQNIMANLKQIADVINMEERDVMMASLPLFHAFGLTVTQFLPLVEGMPMICHPDPTDVVGISKAVARHRASIMFGTSTFLRLFCRNSNVHPLMLEGLRLVVAGAEKLHPNVLQAFKLKFNKDVLEGYGATETTPVASVNLPDSLNTANWRVQLGGKSNTVGMPLPGTSFKIVDPESFEELATGEDGMILIGGAQVMQGYLNDPQATEAAVKVIDGMRWYVTGDKGHLDEDGFLTIIDRYSRFAKIGGEMISLNSVEEAVVQSLTETHPELEVVAVNITDEKKGEQIFLLSEQNITQTEIKSAMLKHGHVPLMIPSVVVLVDSFPKFGSGKTNFAQAKALAEKAVAA